jgi:hypothetical protein
MAIKKKSSEDVDSVSAVSSEDLSIAWEDGIYNFTAGNPLTIPTGLLKYLANSPKVHAIYPATSVEEAEIVEETEVVDTPEESTEEVL